MRVKCGNRRVHGPNEIVFHRTAAEVKECFSGNTPVPTSGVMLPADTNRQRYRAAVDASWAAHCEAMEYFDGEVAIARQARKEFYRLRGVMLSDEELAEHPRGA